MSNPLGTSTFQAGSRELPWWTRPCAVNLLFVLPMLLAVFWAGDSELSGLSVRSRNYLTVWFIALCIGLAFSVVLVPVLWIMLALTTLTAVQRFVMVWRQASTPRPLRTASPVTTRWRTWRIARTDGGDVTRRHDRERWRARRSRRAGTRP